MLKHFYIWKVFSPDIFIGVEGGKLRCHNISSIMFVSPDIICKIDVQSKQ